MNASAQKETGQRLHVAAPQPVACSKRPARRPGTLLCKPAVFRPRAFEIAFPRIRNLRTSHKLILIEKSRAFSRNSQPAPQDSGVTMPIFEYICKECDYRFEALVYGKE